MTKPIQIRNEDVVRHIRELAAIRGRSITEVVDCAVQTELERARRETGLDERRRKVDEALARIRALPVLGPIPTDDDFYDEAGLPK